MPRPSPVASVPERLAATVSRRPLILVALVIAAGLLGYALTGLLTTPPPVAPGMTEQLAWLTREFKLTPAQTAEIERLQTAYEPICAEHCAAVAEAREKLDAAASAEVRAAAEAEMTRLEKICADATRAHLRAVAALMAPAEGARFLAMMEPRVAHSAARAGAPALDSRP